MPLKPRVTIDIDPAEMALRGRIGAHILHSRYDSRELTASARQAFLDKFEDAVDPEGVLPETERVRRAYHARKAYFTRLAYRSAQARRGKKAAQPASPASLVTSGEGG